MRLAFRSAVANDREAIHRLLATCKLAPNGFDRQLGANFVVAVAPDGAIVGVAGVERYGDAGLFRSAAVRPDAQGAGLGAGLTRDRIAWARGQKLTALYLLTETAAEYWPRFGFERIDRDSAPVAVQGSPEWSGGCPTTAVAMRLLLARPPAPELRNGP